MQFKSFMIGIVFFSFIIATFGMYLTDMGRAYDVPTTSDNGKYNLSVYTQENSRTQQRIDKMQRNIREGAGTGGLAEALTTGGLIVLDSLADFFESLVGIFKNIANDFNAPPIFLAFIASVIIITIIGYVLKSIFKVGE